MPSLPFSKCPDYKIGERRCIINHESGCHMLLPVCSLGTLHNVVDHRTGCSCTCISSAHIVDQHFCKSICIWLYSICCIVLCSLSCISCIAFLALYALPYILCLVCHVVYTIHHVLCIAFVVLCIFYRIICIFFSVWYSLYCSY